MRFLYTADTDTLFAYAPGRLDFFLSGDDRLWAHESHDWLIEAETGQTLAHRTGDTYYSAVDGEPLYRVSTERTDAEIDATDPAPTTRNRRAAPRVARARR